jgi:hypothetical protein
MDADPHRFGELLLGETNKAPEGRDILATFKSPLDRPLAQTRGNGAGNILFRELWHFVCHVFRPRANLGGRPALRGRRPPNQRPENGQPFPGAPTNMVAVRSGDF